ncbi:bifunctional adenosylcobinamide kinase/adenosylcobinamide-phosphate guanylyltransferase [Agathobaculum sp. Marseille-P7918]|uniref:bifunctional adenosylcobinamide kinase/adenosylcobinamide-phosphate guanylyltransferase n=1 Tax=Agathobaculum sp. Marseille-P7918 TaxID=2479843 RepID=UPI000F63DCDA|nr:bifunctional adenosylcobinamide kinase/adenosylcobinamide-phosphate guanylyltransferase [Agathobaculum sp. Marseille-P7918]
MTILIIGGAHQGKAALSKRLYPALPLVQNLHERVRDELAAGRDPMALLEALRGCAVTCDEVGCGVVPIDRADEAYREAVGRLCCALAEQADAVVRVTAGLPQYIKGEKSCT